MPLQELELGRHYRIPVFVSKTDPHAEQRERTHRLSVEVHPEHIRFLEPVFGHGLGLRPWIVEDTALLFIPGEVRVDTGTHRLVYCKGQTRLKSLWESSHCADIEKVVSFTLTECVGIVDTVDRTLEVALPEHADRWLPVQPKDHDCPKGQKTSPQRAQAPPAAAPKALIPRVRVLVQQLDGRDRSLEFSPEQARILCNEGLPLETQHTVNTWQRATFPEENLGAPARTARMLKEVAELMTLLTHSDLSDPAVVARALEECADIRVFNMAIIGALGGDETEITDAKMAKNRKRSWGRQPDGSFQHTAEGAHG